MQNRTMAARPEDGAEVAGGAAPGVSPRILVDDRLAKRNAVLLAGAQAFGGSIMAVNIALGRLAGSYLMPDATILATLPVTAMVLGTACGTIPAALLMQRIGRRPGFMTGTAIGAAGGFLACFAILIGDFWLMCLGTWLAGLSFAFVQQYRFAAADVASPAFRAKAISWVLAGGVAAAVIGPQTVIWTKDLFEPIAFAGAYLAQAGLCFVAMAILSFVRIPKPPKVVAVEKGRPILEILSEPRIRIAVVCGIVSYAVMSLMMTAAPIAIVFCGFTTEEAALGIQWHVMAMFAPSFFTGALIARFGAERVTGAGLAILAASSVMALAGIELMNFWLALVLLGVGWNFGFIGATTMLTSAQRPEERGRTQAANDFLVFGTVALASFSSGTLFSLVGWNAINWVILPVTLACLALLAFGPASRSPKAA